MASRPKASSEAKDDQEFDRFQRLTRRLLGVPKKEGLTAEVKTEGKKRKRA